MFNLKKSALAMASVLPIMVGIAAPVSGDFVTRKADTWPKDVVNNSLNIYTQTMCLYRKLHPELNVDGDAYIAKVDFNACAPGQVSKPDDIWRIYKVRVASVENGYVADIWTTATEQNSRITENTVVGYNRLFVSNVVDGDFTLQVCASSSLTGTCSASMYANKLSGKLEAHLIKNLGSPYGLYYHISANVGEVSGYGSITQSSAQSSNWQMNLDMDYSYENNNAVLSINEYKEGNPSEGLTNVYPVGKRCLDRNKENAQHVVYNYEVFNADGSLYAMTHPQIPYRILDENGQFLTDLSGEQISGGVMWDGASNRQGWVLSVDKSVIIEKLNAGQKLTALTWFGGISNYEMEIGLNPDNPYEPGFSLLNSDGSFYQESPALELKLTVNDGVNVGNLLTSALDGTDQTLSYMGNGYIHNIPWDSTNGSGYYIKDGAEVVGTTDGKKYYVRPMFYSIEPSSITCPENADNLIAQTTSTRAALPTAPSFSGTLAAPWVDPRAAMGAPPAVSTSYKYIDGVAR